MSCSLISFIIPSYNIPEHLLRECVDSVMALNLNSHEREIIVIDDGSDIPVENIWNDMENVKTIRQENKGLSTARNTGIAMAEGEYIQFLDADDKLIKQQYNWCLEIIKQEEPDILKFYYSDTFTPKEKIINQYIYNSGAEYMLRNNLQPGACAYIFKKSVLGNLQFHNGIYHEDEEFTPLLFLKAKKTVVTDAKPYFYLKREESITAKFNDGDVKKRLDDFHGIILRLNDILLKERQNNNSPKLISTHDDSTLITGNNSDNSNQSTTTDALQRKVNQATMDYIINVIRLYRHENNGLKRLKRIKYVRRQLESNLDMLKAENLFPLPKKRYTPKYSQFRLLTNNRLMRLLLATFGV